MRAVVTGAAGFLGSHLCDRLLEAGHDVAGIDSFSNYYARELKEQNIAQARCSDSFTLYELDLAESDDDLRPALEGADVIFHLAGRCGLGTFASEDFGRHLRDNVVATHRLLEATQHTAIKRIIYAGSSSVYGETQWYPTKESAPPLPFSSYGVTKLAGENLVRTYGARAGLAATILRFFTIYGPRQRPDMAISRFIQALASHQEIEIVGTGEQTRDFTFVTDAVEATILASTVGGSGQTMNIGGGSHTSVNKILAVLEEMTGTAAQRRFVASTRPEPRHAAASINVARRCLGWEPRTSLRAGLARQWNWFQDHVVQVNSEIAV